MRANRFNGSGSWHDMDGPPPVRLDDAKRAFALEHAAAFFPSTAADIRGLDGHRVERANVIPCLDAEAVIVPVRSKPEAA